MQYAAFLLGINLGTRSVKMADLEAALERAGYKNVRTALASGNVVFDAPKGKTESLAKKLEPLLEKKFGFKIGVIVRTMDEVETMLAARPFKSVKMTKDIRRYVTFLSEKAPKGERPREVSPAFSILKVSPYEVFTVLDLSKVGKTPDVMKYLGTAFGKKTTMRNWNTIEKVAALAG